MAKGSFRIEINNHKLWGIWGIGPPYLIGAPKPRGKRLSPSYTQLREAKLKMLELYETFHNMSYDDAIEKMKEMLWKEN